MKFIADKAIPHINEAFSTIGEVTLMPAHEITSTAVKNADGLLVRTTTRISQELLDNSKIRFVGTATIGTDHVDGSFLDRKGIHLVSAPGCNATAVGEYVLTSLLAIQQKSGCRLQGRTMGIIGCGNTGRAVKRKVEAIGINCILNDPPLAEKSEPGLYLKMEELLPRADILSVHVPLTRTGKYPTFHLIDDQVLQAVKPGTILINTSRGETVDGAAVKNHRNQLSSINLDVWEDEPVIDPDLIPCIDIATPHIAGYSIEGKIKATEILYREACEYFKMPQTWKGKDALSEYGLPVITVSEEGRAVESVVSQVYNILEDDANLRRYSEQDNPGEYFAALRNNYQFRREFSSYTVMCQEFISQNTRQLLSRIGFNISDG